MSSEVDDVNAIEGIDNGHRRAIIELVVERLNAAIARRDLREREGQTLQ